MSEKKKISVSLKTPPHLFVVPLLAVLWIGFSTGDLVMGLLFQGLPVIGIIYGMILITVKEYTEQGVECILEAFEEKAESPHLSERDPKEDE